MKKIKSIHIGKFAWVMAMVFTASACQQDEIIEMTKPMPQGEYISFHIQRGWDYDEISRSAESEYGKHESDHLLTSADKSESIEMNAYQQPIDSWFDDNRSRGSMITSASFNEFMAFGYQTKDGTTTQIFNTHHQKEGGMWEQPKGAADSNNRDGYYWPGAEYTCNFFSIALSDGKLNDQSFIKEEGGYVKTNTNDAGQIVSFDYTVPDAAVDQPDIMVAATGNVKGDGSEVATLNFKHILSAINIKVGVKTGETTMPEGTIQSITFKNVYGKGNYNIVNGSWSGMREANDIRNFSVNLGSGFNTDNISQTTPVTTGTATFMMIPQTLPSNAEIEVVFKHKIGTTSTISASLSGMSWPMGTEINYLISISPEGELKFSSTIPVVDAHYVIVPFKITNNISTSNKTWRLTAYDNNGNDIGIYLRTELSTLQSQGYWTYNEFGSDGKEISRSSTGEVQVYAFIPENNSTSQRDIKLSLYAGSNTEPVTTMSFTQLGLGGANNERIEETGYVPWGFNWDSNTKIIYTFEYDFWKRIISTIYSWFSPIISVDRIGSIINPTGFTVTVNLGAISTSNIGVESTTDGWTNTSNIYNYEGISSVADLKSILDEWVKENNGKITSGAWPSNPKEFAARTCVMKNRFLKDTSSESGVNVDVAKLQDTDLVWYLPASTEYSTLETAEKSSTYKLEGVYWTSTAPANNTSQAYKYTAGTGSSLEDRNNYHKVRCMRKQ